MRFDWQQLSPHERQVLIRHFLFKSNAEVPVTPEKVCSIMQKTHHLSCSTDKGGRAVIQFVTNKRGIPSGVSRSDTFTDGIFKAALRAKGVNLADGTKVAPIVSRTQSVSYHFQSSAL